LDANEAVMRGCKLDVDDERVSEDGGEADVSPES
jgi:hypothetical protein